MDTIFINEQNGITVEAARLAHQHIVTGLTMAGHRVSSKEGMNYSGATKQHTLSIIVSYELISKDQYGNEI